MRKRYPRRPPADTGEFLWLVSLSDLMILLFCLFVALFSFTYKKLQHSDLQEIVAALKNQPPPPSPMEQMRSKLNAWVATQKLSDTVVVEKTDNAVLMQIKEKVLFSSGEFDLHVDGIAAVRSLSKTLENIPQPYHLGIEGHTDDVPIHSNLIQDNWDLSAKRALAVLHALNPSDGLRVRTVLMAHGDTKPVVPNRNQDGKSIPENQTKNRRVTLRIF